MTIDERQQLITALWMLLLEMVPASKRAAFVDGHGALTFLYNQVGEARYELGRQAGMRGDVGVVEDVSELRTVH
jgi:hypothetical protein